VEEEEKIDDLVKSRKTPFSVIPAEAGIQEHQELLDPGFRRGDDLEGFSFYETVKLAAWNSAISTAGTPGGLKKGRWTARRAAAPFRPSSVKRETAWSTRMLPVQKKRKSPDP